jgi:tRNA U34 5-carboxymethylaminomethyl modifying enzyme MnmG/GidA
MMHGVVLSKAWIVYDWDWVLVQPCNPAVGAPGKSQLVHEVDALGGEIGKIADR